MEAASPLLAIQVFFVCNQLSKVVSFKVLDYCPICECILEETMQLVAKQNEFKFIFNFAVVGFSTTPCYFTRATNFSASSCNQYENITLKITLMKTRVTLKIMKKKNVHQKCFIQFQCDYIKEYSIPE